MIWIKHRYKDGSWANSGIFERVEKHFMGASGPREMLMIEQSHSTGDQTIWIRLRNEMDAAVYPEFESGLTEDLPKAAVLLIGHNAEFEKLFRYGKG